MRVKRLLSLFTAVVMLISFVACGYCASEPKAKPTASHEAADVSGITPLLYKVTDSNGNTAWLFGSIHVGKEGMYPLPDYVIDAYRESDVLAVECDIVYFEEHAAENMQALYSLIYSDGTRISEHIDGQLYEDAVKILKNNNYYSSMLDYYIPSMWSQIIDSFVIQKTEYKAELGIDRHFINRAYDDEKPIYEIESVEFQNQMIAGFSPKLQELLLQTSVENYSADNYGLLLSELVDAWCEGNEEKILELEQADTNGDSLTPEQEMLVSEYNNAVVTERNITMADYVEDALASGDTVFICVGAAHVFGADAMVGLLKDRGYKAEAVK